MRIVILGGGGMLGQKVARAMAAKGSQRGQKISHLALADIADPKPVEAPFPVSTHRLDITDRTAVARLFAEGADVIYHLAAVLSGQSEAEFDLGMAVNLQGSINVFEAARGLGTCPVVVFSSTLAVYGGEIPDQVVDWTQLNPQTSYGAAKAAVEMLLTDYSRRGFIDGRGPRLPTISIRPGKPNKAASSFMSSIFREPLQGQPANCPVSPDYPHYYLSPRRCVENLIHAAELPGEAFGENRCFVLPGRTHRIGDMVEAMRRVAGDGPANLITWQREPEVERIVLGWKAFIDAEKARKLGFTNDADFEESIRFFLEEDVER
jgi:nucleoside-diphosphate-sugar epimerase